ncbi:MAG TPA: biotin/lipoyl-containing protein [Noviherbaspirillum sp.]|nr:biotin/lipoyl-containing protein [Noviherbaspirillum sp.]
MPALNSNEDSAEIIQWSAQPGTFVAAGQTIATVETTKTAIDVVVEENGFFAPLHAIGARVRTGEALAVLLDKPDDSAEEVMKKLAPQETVNARKWTKKAELVAAKLGVDIEALSKKLGDRQVTEADVIAANQPERELLDLADDRYPATRRERVLLIGGGGGGGTITIDAINRGTHQRAVGILDNNTALHGKTMLGIPVLGPNAMVEELWQQGMFDAAIVVVTANVDERAALFESISAKGIKFTNVIDPDAKIRTNVQLGVGNLIMANSFLAACVTLGNNNFLASHTCIEHHSVVGSHCTFGPRSITSGAVTIGDRVKFGMNVMLEPYLSVGSGSLIPSGLTVTDNVPPNSVLKIQPQYVIRPRNQK